MNGARVLVKSLEAQGVEYIFGIPGGVLLAVHDALYDSKKIKHVLFRHEQVAAHAADGYARATGRVGVCMATSGPGATNLVTGIANAYMDSVPIVAVTGQVAKTVIGTDAFQEADITGITLPIVKHSYLVSDPADIPRLTKEAFHIASTGRPGPVLIDMPRDISQTEVDYKADQEMALAGYKPTYKGHAKQIKAAAAAIAKSKKPLLYVGGGVITSGGAKELLDLAEHAGIFVTTTLLGKGAFPETHRLSLGMLGMHGTKYANYAISNCDLIIAVGARFDDRVTGKLETFAPGAEVIHIDIDPAEISKNVPAMVPVVGDAKAVLKAILQTLRKAGDQADRTAWDGQVKQWRRDHPLTYEKSGSLKPEQIVEEVSSLAQGRDMIVATGVGQNQMWAAQYYKTLKPRSFISSGGLGTMGFGMPAAIGAQIGRPEADVVVIDGDGSFQMTLQDLATAVENRLPIVVCILNNGYLGMVRQWQEMFFDNRYAAVDLDVGTPDYVKLAEAFGAKGIRVKESAKVKPALDDALKSKVPVIIDFVVAREENVFPMVAPGASLTDMIDPRTKKGGSSK